MNMKKKILYRICKVTMHLLGAIVTSLGLGGILLLGLFL